MDWTFGTVLWSMLLFFFWFALIWMFIGVFADIFRRDMSGFSKAGWIFLIVVLPFVGILIYFIARPATANDAYFNANPAPSGSTRTSPVEDLSRASALYDAGRITEAEYMSLKQRVLA
jgi:hypothetical protein